MYELALFAGAGGGILGGIPIIGAIPITIPMFIVKCTNRIPATEYP